MGESVVCSLGRQVMESTELFVLLLFLVALPLLVALFRDAALPGKRYFFFSFLFLLLSNIFTVVEGWLLPKLFDLMEHLFIMFASLSFYLAIHLFVSSRIDFVKNQRERTGKQE